MCDYFWFSGCKKVGPVIVLTVLDFAGTLKCVETSVWQIWQQDSRNTEVMNPTRPQCNQNLVPLFKCLALCCLIHPVTWFSVPWRSGSKPPPHRQEYTPAEHTFKPLCVFDLKLVTLCLEMMDCSVRINHQSDVKVLLTTNGKRHWQFRRAEYYRRDSISQSVQTEISQ